MPTLFVAKSKSLEKWGAEVGLTKHVYKIGLTGEPARAAISALNEGSCAGHSDWKLVAQREVAELEEQTALERIARKERLVDPGYYPGIKGATGIVKVKPANVENHFYVKQTMAGEEMKIVKVNAAAIAEYLMNSATTS
jgi:hypothetical protein